MNSTMNYSHGYFHLEFRTVKFLLNLINRSLFPFSHAQNLRRNDTSTITHLPYPLKPTEAALE